MFNKNFVLFLKRDSLELYLANSDGPKNKLSFPPEIIKYEEIIDEAKFENLISSFLQKELVSNQKVIILLSQDILFQKTISAKDKNLEEAEIKKFTDEIPFDTSKSAYIKIASGDNIFLVATNKKLYSPIAAACEKLNSQVEAVIHSTIFGISKDLPLTKNDIAQIIKNPKLVNASNFLLVQADTDSQIDQERSKSFAKNNKNILFILLFVLIIIGALSFVLIRQKRSKDSPKKETVTVQTSPIPTPAEESTAAAEVEEVSKDALKIQILNGTGIAGQAQDLADLLKSDGFGDATLSNSPTTGNAQAKVSFKDRVPQIVKDNLVKKLEEIFAEVQVETLQESDFDIEITTGTLKTP